MRAADRSGWVNIQLLDVVAVAAGYVFECCLRCFCCNSFSKIDILIDPYMYMY